MKRPDDRTADGANDGAEDETKGVDPVVPVAAAVAAGGLGGRITTASSTEDVVATMHDLCDDR